MADPIATSRNSLAGRGPRGHSQRRVASALLRPLRSAFRVSIHPTKSVGHFGCAEYSSPGRIFNSDNSLNGSRRQRLFVFISVIVLRIDSFQVGPSIPQILVSPEWPVNRSEAPAEHGRSALSQPLTTRPANVVMNAHITTKINKHNYNENRKASRGLYLACARTKI